MSTVVRNPEYDAAPSTPGPMVSRLDERIPTWMQAPRALVLWTAVICGLFVLLSFRPLWHTDLWGHLSYGRWIWEYGRLPETEPLLPLCRGVTYVDTAWLSQVLGYGLIRQFGIPAMQLLYAATIAATFALLLAGVRRRTQGSPAAGMVALLTLAAVEYQQLLIVRPQLVGLVCFVALFTLLMACRWRAVYWLAVPLLFVLWANLHGSFIVGLGLLATCCMGRAIDMSYRTRSLKVVAADSVVRRVFFLTGLAALAVLLNPYGPGLYAEVFAVAGHPNLQDLIEWKPLTLRMSQGRAAAACVLALIVAYRFSPRRVRASEVLLLAGQGGAALWSSRMIVWWGPVAAYYLALHTAAIFRRRRVYELEPSSRSAMWSVVTVGLVCIFVALTPFWATLLHGPQQDPEAQTRRLEQSTSAQTPHAVVRYLRRHPPQGLVLNTFDWGDYFLWAGPRDLQVFAASHAHLIPEAVWQDYLSILHAGSGWESRLDRYGVNTIALGTHDQQALIEALNNRNDVWRVDYEDTRLVVFVRR